MALTREAAAAAAPGRILAMAPSTAVASRVSSGTTSLERVAERPGDHRGQPGHEVDQRRQDRHQGVQHGVDQPARTGTTDSIAVASIWKTFLFAITVNTWESIPAKAVSARGDRLEQLDDGLERGVEHAEHHPGQVGHGPADEHQERGQCLDGGAKLDEHRGQSGGEHRGELADDGEQRGHRVAQGLEHHGAGPEGGRERAEHVPDPLAQGAQHGQQRGHGGLGRLEQGDQAGQQPLE